MKLVRILAVIFSILFLLIFIADPRQFVTAGIGVLIMLVMGFGLLPIMVNWRSKKNFQTEIDYAYPIEIFITKEKLLTIGKHSKGETLISSFYEFRETNNLILLYKNKFAAFIIPKRDLTHDELKILKKITNLP